MPDKTIRYKVETTGGGAGSVDAVNGNVIVSKDITFAFTSDDNRFLPYAATTGGSSGGTGSSELPPFNITPDANSSKWSWELMRGLNDVVETLTGTTGGTVKNHGVTLIIQDQSWATFTLQTPRAGSAVSIYFGGSSSSITRLIPENSGTQLGWGEERRITHDSDLGVKIAANPLSIPQISLEASGSSQWLVKNQYSSSLRSITSGWTT